MNKKNDLKLGYIVLGVTIHEDKNTLRYKNIF